MVKVFVYQPVMSFRNRVVLFPSSRVTLLQCPTSSNSHACGCQLIRPLVDAPRCLWMNNYTFDFSFPYADNELREKWLNNGFEYKTVSKYSQICSNHFTPENYVEYAKPGGRRKLKKDAVPSIRNHNGPELPNRSCIDDPDVFPESSTKENREREDDERSAKKVWSVAVNTCSRLSGPTVREKELQQKIKTLQDRLRYKEKKIKSVRDLLIQLKEAGKCSYSLEDTFLKTFTEFDLELFCARYHEGTFIQNKCIEADE